MTLSLTIALGRSHHSFTVLIVIHIIWVPGAAIFASVFLSD